MSIPKSGSSGHRVRADGLSGDFFISWEVDISVVTSRIRSMARHSRCTDFEGAVRFARKWGLEYPFQAPEDVRRAAGFVV